SRQFTCIDGYSTTTRMSAPTMRARLTCCLFFFTAAATTEIYTLSLHDALPILTKGYVPWSRSSSVACAPSNSTSFPSRSARSTRSEEHTSELQSLAYLVCRLLLEKKKNASNSITLKPLRTVQRTGALIARARSR